MSIVKKIRYLTSSISTPYRNYMTKDGYLFWNVKKSYITKKDIGNVFSCTLSNKDINIIDSVTQEGELIRLDILYTALEVKLSKTIRKKKYWMALTCSLFILIILISWFLKVMVDRLKISNNELYYLKNRNEDLELSISALKNKA